MEEHDAAFRRIWIDVDGISVHMRVSAALVLADAPTVVLVHGLGLSGRYMRPVAARLARRYKVYLPDLPGFGDSAKPKQVLDVPSLADALAAWMGATQIDHATLLGNSFGCQIIADLAARRPELVERAVLQGPTAPPEERTWFWQFVRWRQNQPYNPRSMGPSTRGDYRKAGYYRILRTFHYSLHDPIEDKLPRILVPVLVIRGGRDPICRQGWAEYVTGRLRMGASWSFRALPIRWSTRRRLNSRGFAARSWTRGGRRLTTPWRTRDNAHRTPHCRRSGVSESLFPP